MTPETALFVVTRAVETVLWSIAWPLGIGLAVGLVVSILQATTQIQEQTLAFIPKIIAILLAVVWFGKSILTLLMDFTRLMFEMARGVVGG
ncbi:MAG: flagellar biosynthesis protein FliQ [Hydrogenibacillus sp.]|nr:flagellar biosynthesis protein FliQ [Hydrogenibacillus sp.]